MFPWEFLCQQLAVTHKLFVILAGPRYVQRMDDSKTLQIWFLS